MISYNQIHEEITRIINAIKSSGGGGGGGGASSAIEISYDNSKSHMTATNVQDAVDEVFQNVSNGKILIAEAITDKGVLTSASDTFQTMATNIEQISVEQIKNIGNLKTGVNTINILDFTNESWSKYEEGSVRFSFSNDNISTKWNGDNSIGALIIANYKINVSYLNTITMKVNATACYGGKFPILIAINPTKNTNLSTLTQNYTKKAEVKNGTIGEIELVIDVSDLNGEYYIHISPVGYTCTITDIILN